MILTNSAIMQQKEPANVVLNQIKEGEEAQWQHMKVAVLQTQKIQELETKVEQQLANITTSNDGSVLRRIPATIGTNTSGGGSTTSTVTSEEMMQMLAKFT